MATSTTNLGLTKPAGTDKIRIAQINGNMDILDEKIGAVGNTSLQAQVTSQNEAITNLQTNVSSGTFNSKSALDTLLNNVLSSIGTDEKKSIKVVCNGAFDIFPNGGTFDCVINKYSSSTSYGTIFMQQVGSSKTIVGNKNDGTWSYEQLALKSETQKFSFSTIVTDFNSALESGIYAGNSATNSPITGWVIVLTMRLTDNNNYIAQIALQFGNNYMYIRTRENGTWKSWKNVSAS